MSNTKTTYAAYSVRERGNGKKPIWTRLGMAWTHREGEGLNLHLEALPINFDGRIVLLPPDSTGDTQEGGDV